MGWIGCARCEKSRHDFVARTFVLIAPVHTVLHRVSCSYETITDEPKTQWNLPKHEFRVQWGGLGAFVAKKIPTWLRGTNFCINCTSSHRFALSFMQLWNDNRWTQTLWNLPKHEFRVQWGGLGAFVAKKSLRDFVARTFALTAPVHTVLHRVLCSYETIPNGPKHYEMHRNMSL